METTFNEIDIKKNINQKYLDDIINSNIPEPAKNEIHLHFDYLFNLNRTDIEGIEK